MEALAQQVGSFMEYWGFKAIHGRIWLYLFLSPQPLDAAALICRVKVSKALISMSISDLLEYDVILEKGKSPKGTLLYAANPDVTSVVFGVLRKRERQMLANAASAFQLVQQDFRSGDIQDGIDGARLQTLGEMVQAAQGALEAFIFLGDGASDADADITVQMTKLSKSVR